MSGSHLPGREPEDPDSSSEPDAELDSGSRAYSAPESEQFTSGPFVSADLRLYDYDESDNDDQHAVPRWPWVAGVAAILAAIALVVSVSLLATRTDGGNNNKLVIPRTTSSTPPIQDAITTTEPPPPPAPSTIETPTVTETQTVTMTPSPPLVTITTTAPLEPTTTSTSTTPVGPRQITYSVTGTKAPGDIISVTYVDASGRRRTQHNVYIPWSMTVTPISQSDVGSVEASSLFRVSKLSCSIITSDGAVLSSNSNNGPQTRC